MTCIIGYTDRENKIMYVGGDSKISYFGGGISDQAYPMNESKVFSIEVPEPGNPNVVHEFLIGCCGTLRILQLLKNKFEPSAPRDPGDGRSYMASIFVDDLRRLLKDHLLEQV